MLYLFFLYAPPLKMCYLTWNGCSIFTTTYSLPSLSSYPFSLVQLSREWRPSTRLRQRPSWSLATVKLRKVFCKIERTLQNGLFQPPFILVNGGAFGGCSFQNIDVRPTMRKKIKLASLCVCVQHSS